MSNYTKSTNFTAKDTLPTGDSSKIVKGTEIDNELTAIASAISSKADSNGPQLTGEPTSTTAPAGNSSTRIATTAFVTTAVSNATGALGTMASQNSNNVTITGGSVTGITDIAVADGGTGRSTLTANNLLVGNGTSAISFIAPGSSGNVLTSNGTSWSSEAITSSVVLYSTTGTTSVTNSDDSNPSTLLSITLTPSSESSKFLIMGCCTVVCNSAPGNGGNLRIWKNSTELIKVRGWHALNNGLHITLNPIYVDSPATTSSITYYLKMGMDDGGTAQTDGGSGPYTFTIVEFK